MSEEGQKNPQVGIAGIIGGISIVIVAIVAIFAQQHFVIAAWIVGALAAMGTVLGLAANKHQNSKKEDACPRTKAIDGE